MLTSSALADLGLPPRVRLADRLRRARGSLLLAAQAGLAAGLAWAVAHDLLHRPRPFFAPIAAVIVLNVSVGQRLRRAVELLVGVTLGILVGDALILWIGTGAWQIALGVAAAIVAASFVGAAPTLIGQAASSAVLVATLAPPSSGIYYSRFIDTLLGGTVGLLVMALLIQFNPLTAIQRAGGVTLTGLADALTGCARSLSERDPAAAQAVLDRLRSRDAALAGFHNALADAREVATLAPVRWRQRGPLAGYLEAAPHIDHAVRNTRVLARRTIGLLRDQEPTPPRLAAAVQALAEAVRTLRDELARAAGQPRTRELVVAVLVLAGEVYRAGLGFHGAVVVAQIRSIGSDLLLATGLEQNSADRVIRRAVGRTPPPGKRPDATP